MGMWVIFIGDEQFCPNVIESMSFEGSIQTKKYGEKQFDVIYQEGYVSFQYDYNGAMKTDYSPEEIADLPYENPQFILMKYSHPTLLKNVIHSADFPENILIDCDGVALGLEQIIDKSRLLNSDEEY